MQIVFSEKCPDVGTFARICWTGVCGAAWAGDSGTISELRDFGLQWPSSVLRCSRTSRTLYFGAAESPFRLALTHFKTAFQGWLGQAD